MNRKREIDGLRALAVLPVILFHADVSIFSGGFVGVDVFFIISGYLITSIVIAELELGTFSLTHFYERRCRRILPALYAALILITPFAWVVLPPAELAEYSKSLAAVPLFVSNFHFASSGNYFETAAELKPLLHTWSLAVEEQYYLVFPIFLALIWRVGKRKVALTIFAIGITSLLAAQVGSTYKPIPNFFLLPTRIWELALGGLIAFYRSSSHVFKPSRCLNELLSGCGFLLLTSSFFYFNKNIPYPSLYTLIPTMGTLLLLLYSNENTIIGRVLSCKVMVYIGLISYSAYLWHQPVLALSRYYFITLNNIQIIVLLAIITLCAIISYRFIETPFRNINLISTKYVFILSIGVGIIIVVFGVLSIKIFDPYSGYGNEARMAQVLTNSKAIYISNVDERLLVKNRIEYNDDSPEAIVLGSSRIMQIGTHNYDKSVINLGVSGASIEDHIAIASLAAPKLDPKTIFIGLDPWLFNADSKQDRWRSLAPEYYSAWQALTKKTDTFSQSQSVKRERSRLVTMGSTFYNFINNQKLESSNDEPEALNKIRHDGSRIYNLSYSSRSKNEIITEFDKLLNYGMTPYSYVGDHQALFEIFLQSYSSQYNIVLILSPYHPSLYQRMQSERPIYLEIETKYRELAQKFKIKIIGSYDPSKVGCLPEQFFDGMHPKDICMLKIMKELVSIDESQ